MIKNISLGQYYPVKSRIHDLDPRLKLFATLLYITVLFLLSNFWGFLLTTLCLLLVILESKVPIVYMLRGLRGIILIVSFTAFFNLFFVEEGTVLIQYWVIRITDQGIINAIKLCYRIALLIVGSSVLTLTTTPIQLTDGLEYFMKPLKVIKVPSHEIAMMMTIALRFIPTLLEEMDKIMKAQAARGADFDTGGIVKKAKSLLPLMVPLFISAFRRAEELALAMEARCYRGDVGRTRMKEMSFNKRDYHALIIIICYAVVALGLNFLL